MADDRRLVFVLHRASRATIARGNADLVVQLGVSVPQLGTLTYVRMHPGCALTELADVIAINKSAMSGMIRRLERAGLLSRKRNSKDGRGMHLFLTEKGERVQSEAVPIFRRALADMTEGFSEAELDVVFKFLNAQVERFGGRQEEEEP